MNFARIRERELFAVDPDHFRAFPRTVTERDEQRRGAVILLVLEDRRTGNQVATVGNRNRCVQRGPQELQLCFIAPGRNRRAGRIDCTDHVNDTDRIGGYIDPQLFLLLEQVSLVRRYGAEKV